jgi:ferrous iron transport protein B
MRALARDLGVPTVPTVARTKEGLHDLVATVAGVVDGSVKTKPARPTPPPEVEQAVAELAPLINQLAPGVPNGRWIALRLLDGDHRVRQALLSGELAELEAAQSAPADVNRSRVIAIQGAQ